MAETRLNSSQFSLKFQNIAATNWVADTTYADYGYKCDLNCPGVTADMYANVIFGVTEMQSGNYASFCETSADTVTLYSTVTDGITVSSIMVM